MAKKFSSNRQATGRAMETNPAMLGGMWGVGIALSLCVRNPTASCIFGWLDVRPTFELLVLRGGGAGVNLGISGAGTGDNLGIDSVGSRACC